MNTTSSDNHQSEDEQKSDLAIHYDSFLANEKKDVEKALYHLEQAYFLSNDKKGEFFIQVCLAFCKTYRDLGEYESAIAYGVQAAEAFEEDAAPEKISQVLNLLALCYMNKGDLGKALTLFFESYSYLEKFLFKNEGISKKIAGIHINISIVFRHNQDEDKTLEHINYALQIFEKYNDIHGLIYCYNAFGAYYITSSAYDKAEDYFKKSLVLAENQGNNLSLAIVHNNLSEIHIKKQELSKALDYALKGLQLKKDLNNHESVLSSYVRISEIYFLLKDYKEALSFLKTAQLLAEETASELQLLEIYEKFASTYVAVEDYKMAYEFQKKYTDLKESIFLGEKNKVIARERNRFEFLQKEQEAELLKQKEAAISEYAERLEVSNQELEQFAHVVSHDLREPLRMVKGYLQIIERRVNFKENKNLKEFFDFAIGGAERMESLIHDVLNLSKVNQQEIILNKIDLNETIFFVIQNLKAFIEDKNAEIYYENLSTIQADQSQMIQLFQNIINNGLKYNESDRPTVWITQKDLEEHIEISIKDNGIGIPKAYQEKVFQMFQRLHGNRFSGTGIGLATCKKIIDRHQGNLRIESEEGRGSTFYITLPKEKAS